MAKKKIEKVDDLDKTIMKTIGDEIKNKDKRNVEEVKEIINNNYKHPIIDITSFITLIFGVISFMTILFFTNTNFYGFISNLFLIVFTITFVVFTVKLNKKNKGLVLISNILLILFFILNTMNSFGVIKSKVVSNNRMINLSGKTIEDASKWASSNNITLKQEYEYSDIIPVGKIISQSITDGDVIGEKVLTVEISEGPSPYKEVIIPDFSHWKLDKVVEFIKKNHLFNVDINFTKADEEQDTVISQSIKGTIKRGDLINITFATNREIGTEFKIKDLVNSNKLDALIYLKSYLMNIDIKFEYSDSIEKDRIISQSIKKDSITKTGEAITIVISKGKKISSPNFIGMKYTDVVSWAIKNGVKLEVSDKYDDSIPSGSIVLSNYDKNMAISNGDTLKIVVSKGKLKLPNFKNKDEFVNWATKYSIQYGEEHEFSDTVPIGGVIRYSHNAGDIIKNGDAVKVYISNGKKVDVPSVYKLSKNKATNILQNAGFKVSYAYSSSRDIAEGYVVRQSPVEGSTVSNGSTITIVISTGPPKNNYKPNNNGNYNNHNNNNNNHNNPPPAPACDKSITKAFIKQVGNNGYQTQQMLIKANPGIKINAQFVDRCPNGAQASGSYCSGPNIVNYCDTYTVVIVK